MKYLILFIIIFTFNIYGQSDQRVKIMTLGVFHFDYPNLDFIKTAEKDKISVLEEPYQSEIAAICSAVEEFNPTIIAVEMKPSSQRRLDSLYSLYRKGEWMLKANEVYQLGFRLGKVLALEKLYCVDDAGRHYENLTAIFGDSLRMKQFEYYYLNPPDTLYLRNAPEKKISSIAEALYNSNNPDKLKERLATYLLHPFKYEEQQEDFTGVDFESGRWF